MTFIVPPKYLAEIAAPVLPLERGDVSNGVKRAQEWLTFAGNTLVLDGDFGPATEQAVKAFRRQRGVYHDPADVSGVIDADVWGALIRPIQRATAIPGIVDQNLGAMVVRHARQYLEERACEVGPDNHGPWQRHFSRGRQGQPWCQDFVSTCYFDAARTSNQPLPFDLMGDGIPSSYVPWVANSARRAGKHRRSEDAAQVPPGSMFFLKFNSSQVPYSHVGIVVEDHGDVLWTIEGNSNNNGSANGYAVVGHYRRKSSCDFGVCT